MTDKPDTYWKRERHILAKSIYGQLKDQGLTTRQIIEFANLLLVFVSREVRQSIKEKGIGRPDSPSREDLPN
ncbi:hypothetical protein HOG48_03475 [Candidatus Peregrinibacteria bacterium]|jgi:hypothetical protein|nr:hypothetical protein [Candidatus Peregrinibacteria bacterium]